jgi:hypothetical protein
MASRFPEKPQPTRKIMQLSMAITSFFFKFTAIKKYTYGSGLAALQMGS